MQRLLQTFATGYPEGLTAALDTDDTDLETGGQLTHDTKRCNTFELVLCLLMRTRNMHVRPFFTVGLSVLALRAGVPGTFWTVLTGMYLLMAKQWTLTFCALVSERLAQRQWEFGEHRVRFLVCDNCSYAAAGSTRRNADRHCRTSGSSAGRSSCARILAPCAVLRTRLSTRGAHP